MSINELLTEKNSEEIELIDSVYNIKTTIE